MQHRTAQAEKKTVDPQCLRRETATHNFDMPKKNHYNEKSQKIKIRVVSDEYRDTEIYILWNSLKLEFSVFEHRLVRQFTDLS